MFGIVCVQRRGRVRLTVLIALSITNIISAGGVLVITSSNARIIEVSLEQRLYYKLSISGNTKNRYKNKTEWPSIHVRDKPKGEVIPRKYHLLHCHSTSQNLPNLTIFDIVEKTKDVDD